jgi:hypothetical protein
VNNQQVRADIQPAKVGEDGLTIFAAALAVTVAFILTLGFIIGTLAILLVRHLNQQWPYACSQRPLDESRRSGLH